MLEAYNVTGGKAGQAGSAGGCSSGGNGGAGGTGNIETYNFVTPPISAIMQTYPLKIYTTSPSNTIHLLLLPDLQRRANHIQSKVS